MKEGDLWSVVVVVGRGRYRNLSRKAGADTVTIFQYVFSCSTDLADKVNAFRSHLDKRRQVALA